MGKIATYKRNRASDVGQNELSRRPDRSRPHLVTFGTEAEQAAALQNAKK